MVGGAVGQDDAGASLLSAMTAAGVDVQDVSRADAATGTALVLVDGGGGENQIVVCPGANALVSWRVLRSLMTRPSCANSKWTRRLCWKPHARPRGFFVLNAAPAAPIIPELLERCDLVIVNETEYQLIPALRDAPLVAVTYGGGEVRRSSSTANGWPGGLRRCESPTLPTPSVPGGTPSAPRWSWRSSPDLSTRTLVSSQRRWCRRCQGQLLAACAAAAGALRRGDADCSSARLTSGNAVGAEDATIATEADHDNYSAPGTA